ncbi:hypothetical protein [Shewanella mangrovisoli]|uniref:hypothetical protein n=1 Tax=Shewanella mangrovisoli TaxID=2864211 RepID=UPI0035BA4A6C
MTLEAVPLKLVETWFWMVFSCNEPAVKKAGRVNIEKHFGSIATALKQYPNLQQHARKTVQ